MKMWFIRSLFLISTLLFIHLDIGRAQDDCQPGGDTITVGSSGGKFTTISDAIKSIKAGDTKWKTIHVAAGIYKEQVVLPVGVKCLVIQGAGKDQTSIEFDAHSATDTSPTFKTFASNFVARDISFKNNYNKEIVPSKGAPALAIAIYGDKSAFYNCGFFGVQDTIWARKGRHYFRSCHIEGGVDFIWGGGQSFFEDCEIKCLDMGKGFYGYITAQDRRSADEPSGFVFKGGKVTGSGSTNLGRAYGPHSRVLWYGTNFAGIVRPEGWWSWHQGNAEATIIFAEESCTGPGADKSGRVKWLKKLSQAEINKLTNIATFIDQDSWISKLPSGSSVSKA